MNSLSQAQHKFMIESSFFTHLFRFYSKCLAPPYNELGLELQHIFRQMEINCQNELDEQLAAHALDILNFLQGEEISLLQAEYSRMFSHVEDEKPLLSIRFTKYDKSPETQNLMDDIYDAMLQVSYDESPDSLINFLDYFSYLSEAGEVFGALLQYTRVIAPFSEQFYRVSNINFYKEVAKGLNELCLIFNEYLDN